MSLQPHKGASETRSGSRVGRRTFVLQPHKGASETGLALVWGAAPSYFNPTRVRLKLGVTLTEAVALNTSTPQGCV